MSALWVGFLTFRRLHRMSPPGQNLSTELPERYSNLATGYPSAADLPNRAGAALPLLHAQVMKGGMLPSILGDRGRIRRIAVNDRHPRLPAPALANAYLGDVAVARCPQRAAPRRPGATADLL